MSRRGTAFGTTTVTSKGQITIPAAVARRLGLKRGDKVVVTPRTDGTIEFHIAAPEEIAVLPSRGKRQGGCP